MNTTRYIDVAEVAKLIRADLKAVFGKAVKFQVRTSRYAGGSSIRVRWTDGPTQKMVESIVKGYAGGGFDGMTDYKYRFDSFLDGERVRFGGDFIFCDRDTSEETRQRIADREGLDVESLDDAITIGRECAKRCDARIFSLYAENFTGPRAVADVEQAEETRTAVYPRQEQVENQTTGCRPVDEPERYDNVQDAVAAARAGKVVSIMDLIPKKEQ